MTNSTRQDLFAILDSTLSEEDLRDVVFYLGLDWDNLPGPTKRSKIRALIEHCERHNSMEALQNAVQNAQSYRLPKSPVMRDRRWQIPVGLVIFAIIIIVGMQGFFSPLISGSALPTIVANDTQTPVHTNFTPSVLQHVDKTAISQALETATPQLICPHGGISSTSVLTMVFIPEGDFVMGNDESTSDDDKPEHSIHLSAFLVDKYEVTNIQYEAFIKATNHPAPISKAWANNTWLPSQAFYPVVGVTWQDASAYCAWAGKRLPTEAEWELACRGRSKFQFPWGNKWEAQKTNNPDVCPSISPVGSFSLRGGDSPFGIADMSGNVFEWTMGQFAAYPFNQQNALRPTHGEQPSRLYRGGIWDPYTKDYELSCTRRMQQMEADALDITSPNLGFRCVQSISH